MELVACLRSEGFKTGLITTPWRNACLTRVGASERWRRRRRRQSHGVGNDVYLISFRLWPSEQGGGELPPRPTGRTAAWSTTAKRCLRRTRPPSDVYTTMERPCLESRKTNVSVVGVSRSTKVLPTDLRERALPPSVRPRDRIHAEEMQAGRQPRCAPCDRPHAGRLDRAARRAT
ncbi:hypothetical protein CSHISOI_10727 [Colletotrichum shisoi]|uniref:Uncharacterized protein n=1 Tax=Colletotrichum shisoi TaxID=2078593 RepID=A0A5Q4BD77_9PEZI|nr:hypothetical protein CSHISOI_10727 [Colletotrichum shisoi]